MNETDDLKAWEARITAWVLGEVSDFDQAELEQAIAEMPELEALKFRIEEAHGRMTEVGKEDRKAWKLPRAIRRRLLALFESRSNPEGGKQGRTRDGDRKFPVWLTPLMAVAAVLLILFMLFPALSNISPRAGQADSRAAVPAASEALWESKEGRKSEEGYRGKFAGKAEGTEDESYAVTDVNGSVAVNDLQSIDEIADLAQNARIPAPTKPSPESVSAPASVDDDTRHRRTEREPARPSRTPAAKVPPKVAPPEIAAAKVPRKSEASVSGKHPDGWADRGAAVKGRYGRFSKADQAVPDPAGTSAQPADFSKRQVREPGRITGTPAPQSTPSFAAKGGTRPQPAAPTLPPVQTLNSPRVDDLATDASEPLPPTGPLAQAAAAMEKTAAQSTTPVPAPQTATPVPAQQRINNYFNWDVVRQGGQASAPVPTDEPHADSTPDHLDDPFGGGAGGGLATEDRFAERPIDPASPFGDLPRIGQTYRHSVQPPGGAATTDSKKGIQNVNGGGHSVAGHAADNANGRAITVEPERNRESVQARLLAYQEQIQKENRPILPQEAEIKKYELAYRMQPGTESGVELDARERLQELDRITRYNGKNATVPGSRPHENQPDTTLWAAQMEQKPRAPVVVAGGIETRKSGSTLHVTPQFGPGNSSAQPENGTVVTRSGQRTQLERVRELTESLNEGRATPDLLAEGEKRSGNAPNDAAERSYDDFGIAGKDTYKQSISTAKSRRIISGEESNEALITQLEVVRESKKRDEERGGQTAGRRNEPVIPAQRLQDGREYSESDSLHVTDSDYVNELDLYTRNTEARRDLKRKNGADNAQRNDLYYLASPDDDNEEAVTKYHRILIPELRFKDADVREVFQFLEELTKVRDPEIEAKTKEGIGVRFRLQLDPATANPQGLQQQRETIPNIATGIVATNGLFDLEDDAIQTAIEQITPSPGDSSQVGLTEAENTPRVNLDVRRVTLSQALEFITASAGLQYETDGDTIVIKPQDVARQASPPVIDEDLVRKMKAIALPELKLSDANLGDVLPILTQVSRARDPEIDPDTQEGIGVNMTLQMQNPQSGQSASQAPAPITVDLKNVSFYDAVKTISEITGLEMVPADGVLKLRSTGKTGRQSGIALGLEGLDPNELLPLLETIRSADSELRVDREKSILVLHDDPEKTRRVRELVERLRQKQANKKPSLDEKSATDEPFSTFSLHVSDVSFKLAYNALQNGQFPNPDTVRAEEFINALDYGDPAPSQAEKIACRLERSTHPFRQGRDLLRIALRTAAVGRNAQQPLHLTLLLDISGSMERADRQDSLTAAAKALATQLGPNDRVTVIGFARTPRLLAEGLTQSTADRLPQIVINTPSEGGTNLDAAMALAAQKAHEQFNPQAVNRIVLLTDGAANLGNADPESLAKRVVELRQSGIAFDACGIGAGDLNDTLLEALTRQGDGRYYVLNAPEDADRQFANQLAGALRPAAKNVKVQVQFNPQRIGRYRLIGFEKHRLKKEDFRNDAVDAAEMAAAEAGVALYEVEVLPNGDGPIGEVSVRFRDLAEDRMVEKSWCMDAGSVPDFYAASDSIQVAGSAAFLAEKLKGGPGGNAVRLEELAPGLDRIKSHCARDQRVQMLAQMIEWTRGLEFGVREAQ